VSEPTALPASFPDWTFLSNHAHVLVCLSTMPDARLRDISARVGVTERAVQKLCADLEAAGFLERQRVGRRNVYRLHLDRPLRHPLESHHTAAELLALLAAPPRVGEGRSES